MKTLQSSAVCLILMVALAVAGCDMVGSNEGDGSQNISIQFETVNNPSKTASSSSFASEHDSVVIEGSNGTLLVNDIRFIVEKFKLEREDDACEEADTTEGGDEDCEEFESDPFFVDLPLNDDTLHLADDEIQAGLYEELEFEVKDLDFDEEEDTADSDEDDRAEQALVDSIRAAFPEWPEEASMVLSGTFFSADGDTTDFRVFARAEIEVEMEFEPPLEVTEENMGRVLSVRIDPSKWFEQQDGTVFDISRYDWETHQELLEFSAKFKDGLVEIKVDDDLDPDED